LKPKNLIRM